MIDEPDELDRLAGQLFQGVITPEMLPQVIASLAAWLQPAAGADLEAAGGAVAKPAHCPLTGSADPANAPCRRMRQASGLPDSTADRRAVCALLDRNRPDWRRLIDLFAHCRALREFADHAASWAHTSHVAAIILTQGGRVLECDFRGESLLKAANVLRLVHGQLCCTQASLQPHFDSALTEAVGSGRTTNILVHAPEQPDKRFSVSLTPMQQRSVAVAGGESAMAPDVLCLVAALDGRRIATARQLMDFFGLSSAEARLARALCHGDSLEDYARDEGLRLPTVRTQLSATFKKTGTKRQAALVRLIAGIPVVRDAT
jgi:DNA-binding CsgD family transcriptional regulator